MENGRKVLVTGATGFVGSTLCDELAKRDVSTKVLMRSSRGNLQLPKIETIKGDLRDPTSLKEAVKDIDTIFHVAGVVAAKSRNDYFQANAQGTKNLIKAARESGRIKRFVYISSLAAAGPSTPESPRIESQLSEPVSFYGESKLAGEEEALMGSKDFEVVIVRPPAVYGPRDKGIFTFFQLVKKGILPILGTQIPDPRRYSFVHVNDLVEGILLAGEKPIENGDIFYISGEGEYSWEDAMKLIAKGLKRETFSLRIPIPLLYAAAGAYSLTSKITGKVFPFSLDKMKEINALAWTCSNQKAKEKLGFTPYWSLEKGFEQTARWYQESAWL